MTTEIDGVLRSVGDSIATALFRDGSGAIGQISTSTTVGSAIIDLVKDTDVTNFEVGMKLQASATKSGGSVRTGTIEVASVNRTATTNQITCTGNLTAGISAIAQSDYLYVQGNYDSTVTGLEGWIPTTAPTSGDSFFGQDRSTDATRLGGQRIDGSSMTIVESLIN